MTVLESVWWYSSILKYGVGTTRAPKALAKLPQSLIAFAQGGRYATLINRQLHGGSLTWRLVLWARLLFCTDFFEAVTMQRGRMQRDRMVKQRRRLGTHRKTPCFWAQKAFCTEIQGGKLLLVPKKPFMLNHYDQRNSCESTQVSQAISEMLQILAEVPQEKRMDVFMGISALYRYAR